jgi:hypothetical protein
LVEQAAFAKSLVDRFAGDYKITGSSKNTPAEKIPLGTEKWLDSHSLGIGGKVDLIYRENDGGIRIVDFKTGKVNDSDGNPKPAYLLQLAAYGRIIIEREPGIKVNLELMGRIDTWSALFDEKVQKLIDVALHEFSTLLPLNKPLERSGLARLGEHCSTCSFRPNCGIYLQDLNERMKIDEFQYEEYSLDIMGEVLDIDQSNGLTSIRCKVQNGRTILISRIPSSMLPKEEIRKGQQLIVFGLLSLENKMLGTFPCNFFLFDPNTPRKSAFQSYLSII